MTKLGIQNSLEISYLLAVNALFQFDLMQCDKIFLFLDYNSFYICKNINDINSSIKKIKGNNKMEKKNLWILTEERPKKSVIYKIIEKFVKDYKKKEMIYTW